MIFSTIVIGATAVLPDAWRLPIWAVFLVGWLGLVLVGSQDRYRPVEGIVPTDSLVERFGLFTIIVLGEVILGVVTGLSAAGADALTIATGSLAMVIGFGFWWIYFDLVGRRLSRGGSAIWIWMTSHLPIQLSIVASGAAIVSLIEHARDPVTPPETALLLGGSVAIGLLAMILTERSLEDAVRLESVYRPLGAALAIGAVDPRGAPRRDPDRAVVLRRRPDDPGRGLGRRYRLTADRSSRASRAGSTRKSISTIRERLNARPITA